MQVPTVPTPSFSSKPIDEGAPSGVGAMLRSLNEGDGRSDQDSAYDVPPFGSRGNSSRPPCIRWAEKFDYLVADSSGVLHFKIFLESENAANLLDFWFACQGFRNNILQHEIEKIQQLVKVIYRTYIRPDKSLPISPETRRQITESVHKNKDRFQQNIFAQAQEEVERVLRHTWYPAFLVSDTYVSVVQRYQTEQQLLALGGPLGTSALTAQFQTSLNLSCVSSGVAAPTSALETVHEEDTNANNVTTAPLTPANLLQTRFYRACQPAHFQLPVSPRPLPNPYHISYAPVSAENSELQSISSGAVTDETRSYTTDSSLDATNLHHNTALNRQWKQRRRAMRRSALLNQGVDDLQHQVLHGSFLIPRPHTNNNNMATTSSALPSAVAPPLLPPHCNWEVAGGHLPPHNPTTAGNRMTRNLAEVDPASFVSLLSAKLQAVSEERSKDERFLQLMNSVDEEAAGSQSQNTTIPKSEQHDSSGQSATAATGSTALFGNSTRSSDAMPLLLRQPWAAGILQAAASSSMNSSGVGRGLSQLQDVDDAQAILEYHCSRVWDNKSSAERTPPQQVDPVWQAPSWMYVQNQQSHTRNASEHSRYATSSSSSDKVKAWIYEANEHQQRILQTHHSRLPAPSILHDMFPAVVPPQTGTLSDYAATGAALFPTFSDSRIGMQPMSDAGFDEHVPAPTTTTTTTNIDKIVAPPQPLTVGYYLAGDPVPYRVQWWGDPDHFTLADFKQLIAKKGHFRYFFKRRSDEFETGVVQEEVRLDSEVLPLWEGKVVAKVERID